MFDGLEGLSYNDYVCLCPQANIRHRKEFYMIKSMTGFGRAELVDEEKKNHGGDEIGKSPLSGY